MSVEEIEFGSVETVRHAQRLRPDRDRRFAVVPCGVPADDDLPIFVALDALRDMEAHALSDARVELGGVLLGESCEDDRGMAFVVIADSLRARHYESTSGSFKFTHETWAEFTRQRAGMAAELQMVGWYHTHPNLGVFLSELDRFICEHFFSRPSDVALVIDPCRQDRGFFQWSGFDAPQRTGGFYVFASRHRTAELKCLVAFLELRWNALSFS
jgi:proteasome lid subunit RPN8/RPN11